MKKLNAKGFTLIELLAVVTIMGILMLVAIPAVARTIENTRRDTFMNTAKEYTNSVKTLWLSDGIVCKNSGGSEKYPSQAANNEEFYVRIDSKYAGTNNTANGNYGYIPVLLQQGGKSSWSNSEVTGYVRIITKEESAGLGRTRIVPYYFVAMVDGTHGIKTTLSNDAASGAIGSGDDVQADNLKRRNVDVSGATDADIPTGAYICEEV